MYKDTHNKLLNFVPATKSVASTGLPTLRCGSQLAKRYRGAGFIYKGIAVTGSSMLYSRILSNCSIGSVRNSKAF
jgi:hypothetical protein